MTPKKPAKKSCIIKRPRKRHAQPGRIRSDNPFAVLGAVLQERRVQLGLTQKRFEELSGLRVATISKIEGGDLGVKLGTLKAYLELLNLTLRVVEADDIETGA